MSHEYGLNGGLRNVMYDVNMIELRSSIGAAVVHSGCGGYDHRRYITPACNIKALCAAKLEIGGSPSVNGRA